MGIEQTATNIWTDSPTVYKENIDLVAAIAAANNWKIHSLDVKLRFLKVSPLTEQSYLVPLPEATDSNAKL